MRCVSGWPRHGLPDLCRVVLYHERHQVSDALTARLHLDPQFKVRRPVVGLDAVLVMDVFTGL
jgi:hypothetical protein